MTEHAKLDSFTLIEAQENCEYGGVEMAKCANLDAMIRREDLDLTDNLPAQVKIGTELKLAELERTSLMFNVLRKPDFQRETANWDADKIVNLIKSFLDGDLIPSVIVWRSNKNGNLFVIDGAHRLSALISWVNDDYGDEHISRELFGAEIDVSQIKIAQKVRKQISDQIGSYQRLKQYITKPEGAPDQIALLRGRNIASLSITLQDVKGDVANAERSFLRINQSATPIHPTELVIIQSRQKANAMAARALLRSGSGHAYWSAFEDAVQNEITTLASGIYHNLFKPILEYPIRTLALPAAGQALTADSLDLVFNLVNHVNHITDASTKKEPIRWKIKSTDGAGDKDLPNDPNGEQTIKFLQSVRSWTNRVFGKSEGSLALHPGVYCYGATGKFHPTAFFAAINFVQWLENHKKFDYFTMNRSNFEAFILTHRLFINQIVGSYGSQLKGLPALTKMYKVILENVASKTFPDIVKSIQADPELSFVRETSDDDRKYGRNFSRETSSAIYLRDALAKELTCAICGARIHSKMITLDHKNRKEDGGLGTPANGQLAHPYCNTGYKEKNVHAAAR